VDVPAPPRNPQPRRALTETEILDAALALVDAGGPAAAGIRRIAAAVSAAPSTVYTYFPEQAAVHRALVDRLLGEVDVATPPGGTWQQGMSGLALALRARLAAHPSVLPLLLSDRLTGPNAAALGERVRSLLSAAGMTGEDTTRGAHMITAYVLGAIALDSDAEQFRWGLDRVLGGLIAAG
jgi:TetR/AcrR family transcriptional regulator, tetracycline repressor protein